MNQEITITIPGNMIGGDIRLGEFYYIELLLAYKNYNINLLNGKYKFVKYIPGLRERGYKIDRDTKHKIASCIDGYQIVIKEVN